MPLGFRPTCHAGNVDDASSGPPQQREEGLRRPHGTQEVHVHAASEPRERTELCVAEARKDSCVIHQTPQACRGATREVKKDIVRAKQKRSKEPMIVTWFKESTQVLIRFKRLKVNFNSGKDTIKHRS